MKADIFLNSPGLEGLLTLAPASRRTVAQSLLREEWVVSNLSRRGAGVVEVDTAPPTHKKKRGRGKGARGFRSSPHHVRGRRANREGGTDSCCWPHLNFSLSIICQRPRLMLSRLRLVMWVSHLFLKLFIHGHKQNEKTNEMRVVVF